jgi:hypothetical protein
LFLQFGFQPGSPGQIISLRAVGDGNFHGEFPCEKYWLMAAGGMREDAHPVFLYTTPAIK